MTEGPHADVVVAGGGLPGLYAALSAARQGAKVVVLEKEDSTGGCHRAHRLGRNRFNLSPDALTTRDADLAADLEELLPEGAVTRGPRPGNWIRWHREDMHFPMRFLDFARGISGSSRLAALRSLPSLKLAHHRQSKPPGNAEEAFRQRLGKPLYQEVFEADLSRFWGMDLQQLSPKVADLPHRMILDWTAEEEGSEETTIEDDWWTVRVGAGVLAQQLTHAIDECGGKIFCGAEWVDTEMEDRQITRVIVKDLLTPEEEAPLQLAIPCRGVISTVPLRSLVKALGSHAPAQIHASSYHLAYRPVHAFACLVQRKRCLDHLTVHFRDRSFLRVTEPSHAGQTVTPEDHTLLVVEISEHAAASAGESWVKVVSDLEAEGICHRGEILEQRVFRNPGGYPVYRREFEPHHDRILNFLAKVANLRTAGATGCFSFDLPAESLATVPELVDQTLRQLAPAPAGIDSSPSPSCVG